MRGTATVGASVALVVGRSRGAHERHHLGHLREEGSFTSGNGGLAGLNRSSSKLGGRESRSGLIGRRGVGLEKALGDEIGNGSHHDTVGLMKHVSSRGESSEIGLSGSEMSEHVGPGAVHVSAAIPEAEVVLEQRNLGEDDKSDVHLLTVGHEGTGVLGEIGEIVNCSENSVNRNR
jgi:hypothetical protein